MKRFKLDGLWKNSTSELIVYDNKYIYMKDNETVSGTLSLKEDPEAHTFTLLFSNYPHEMELFVIHSDNVILTDRNGETFELTREHVQ
jgi:hypothetical protein